MIVPGLRLVDEGNDLVETTPMIAPGLRLVNEQNDTSIYLLPTLCLYLVKMNIIRLWP